MNSHKLELITLKLTDLKAQKYSVCGFFYDRKYIT